RDSVGCGKHHGGETRRTGPAERFQECRDGRVARRLPAQAPQGQTRRASGISPAWDRHHHRDMELSARTMNPDHGRAMTVPPLAAEIPLAASDHAEELSGAGAARDAGHPLPHADAPAHGELPLVTPGEDGRPRLRSMPEIRRVTMVSSPIDRRPLARLWR